MRVFYSINSRVVFLFTLIFVDIFRSHNVFLYLGYCFTEFREMSAGREARETDPLWSGYCKLLIEALLMAS